MNISVVGTGYVGLVTGTCFAESGNNVTCIDIDIHKVNKLKSGIITIYEPGLETIFTRNLEAGRLNFTNRLDEGIKNADIIFLALPTPPGEDGSADLSYILKVATDLSTLIDSYTVIVDKSTVPVGTAEKVHHILSKRLSSDLFDVVSNPEFLREGSAVEDFMKPDRVVVGVESERAEKLMKKLYTPFVRQNNPIFVMDIRSAEMTKYAANSYLATRISFMNEVANLCELLGADVNQVRKGMGSDSRIGQRFLFPGVGYGGSCFPKDVKALAKTAEDSRYNFSILRSVIHVNRKQRLKVVDKLFGYFDGNLRGKKIGIWGLAFKPNTDDIREAPALYTIEKLIEAGAQVTVHDPEAMDNVKEIFGNRITYCADPYGAAFNVDALAIMTEWNVFRIPDFNTLWHSMSNPVIIDGRNLYDPEEMKNLGFYYDSIGRSIVNSKAISESTGKEVELI